MRRNHNLERLHSNYLFAEIAEKKKAYQEKHPEAQVISLGVGDTTQPISEPVVKAWKAAAEALGDAETYTGYEQYQGRHSLCSAIVRRFYEGRVKADEVFISDGAKSALGRLQLLYPSDAVIGVQDPAYPVYVDTSVLMGHSMAYDRKALHYRGIVYLPCTKENGFFPDFRKAPKVDVIYVCSPNNPTGYVPDYNQLSELVEYALEYQALIIFDSAYAAYVEGDLPRTIYDVPQARKVAIEVGSFSKLAGFSGVRLGWVVVPKELAYDAGGGALYEDWSRINSVFFNGASNLAQAGGLAVLSDEGWDATRRQIEYYKENARILTKALKSRGLDVYGGKHAPYLWVEAGGRSWKMFDYYLSEFQLITTPGVGFGPGGEGFLRFSALGRREDVEEAARRLSGGG